MRNKISIILIIAMLGLLSLTFSPSVSAIVTVPDAPGNFTATLITGTHNYELDWDAPASDGGSTITGYRIEIAAANTYGTESTHWNLLTITEDTLTNYTHEQTAAYSYCYRVFAINSEGVSLPSNYDNCWSTEAQVPDSIYILDLSVISGSQIDLSWMEPNDNGLPIIGYKIDYKVNDVEYILVENTGTTDTTYSHTDLLPNTNYNYMVYAVNDLGPGPSYGWESATTFAGPIGVPMMPENFIIFINYGSLDLQWDVPSYDGGSPILGYKIEHQTRDKAFNLVQNWTVLVENTSDTSTSYRHDNINDSVYHCYRVYAINQVGVGEPCSRLCKIPYPFTAHPTTVTQSEDSPGFELILFLITTVFIIFWKKKKK